MAKDCSFDIVSEFDRQELVNAVDQVKRDVASRFDFQGPIRKQLLKMHNPIINYDFIIVKFIIKCYDKHCLWRWNYDFRRDSMDVRTFSNKEYVKSG